MVKIVDSWNLTPDDTYVFAWSGLVIGRTVFSTQAMSVYVKQVSVSGMSLFNTLLSLTGTGVLRVEK